MGFVDSFINTYTQQQQLKQQRQEWETQQALREADAIARQQDMRERAIDRDMDRELKRQSMLDMEEQRKWSREDREDEQKRKREKDRRDAIEHSLKMGYTPKQAEAMADSRSDVPPAYKPKPLKKQIGVAEGDVLANVPANIAGQLSQVLPQMFGGIAGLPAQQGMQAAGPMMQQAGAQGIDQERAAIDIANEILQEQNAQGMEQAQMQGNLPSPEFQMKDANAQSLIGARNAGINDKLAQREIQRQALDLKTQQVVDNSMRAWMEERRKWAKDEATDVLQKDANQWRKEHARRQDEIRAELGRGNLALKKLSSAMTQNAQGLRSKELDLQARRLDEASKKTLVQLRGQAVREVSDASKSVSALSRDEQSLIRAISDTVSELQTKEGIKDPRMILHRTQPMHQKLADVRERLQAAKEMAKSSREMLQRFPQIKLQDAETGRTIAPKKPSAGAPTSKGVDELYNSVRSRFLKKN